jgi:hypothetical protein
MVVVADNGKLTSLQHRCKKVMLAELVQNQNSSIVSFSFIL